MAKLPKSLSLLLASLVLCATALVACSSNSEEEAENATVFNLTIEDGELNIESGLIRAEQGDDIILRVNADEKGVLHLHGYDIFREIGPDGLTCPVNLYPMAVALGHVESAPASSLTEIGDQKYF